MIGLGDLDGGSFWSEAVAASSDGSVIVGHGTTEAGSIAFRWTKAGGMEALTDPAERLLMTSASAVSGNGSVIVGGGPSGAMIWDRKNGLRDIKELLSSEGINLPADSRLIGTATDISADGTTIVGNGISSGGNDLGWVITGLPKVPIDENPPKGDEPSSKQFMPWLPLLLE
jgi:uncharacterized membrane protein